MAHRIATIKVHSTTPLSQSGFYQSTRPQKQSHEDFEKENWREKMHVSDDGQVFVPPMAFKRATDEACKRLAIQIPGKGKTQFTKYLVAGAMIVEPVPLADGKGKPIMGDDVEGEWLWCDAQGKKGGASGSMVRRCFPIIPEWKATLEYQVFDDTITRDVFEKCFESGGMFVGVGRFRPENGGYYGRYAVSDISWKEL